MADSDDDKLRRALERQKRKSKGNPPKGWKKAHPLPKKGKKNGDK